MKTSLLGKSILALAITLSLSSCSNMSGKKVAKGVGAAFMVGGLAKYGSSDNDQNPDSKSFTSDEKQGIGLAAIGGLIYYMATRGEEVSSESSNSSSKSKEDVPHVSKPIPNSEKNHTLRESRKEIAGNEKIREIDRTILIIQDEMKGVDSKSEKNKYIWAIDKLKNDKRKLVKSLNGRGDSYGFSDMIADLKAAYPPGAREIISRARNRAIKQFLNASGKK